MAQVSRRGFLSLGAAALATGCARKVAVRVTPQPALAPPPFKVDLGLQSYSLRAFKFDDVVAKMQQVGLHFVEFFPAHFPQNMTREELESRKAKLAAAQIQVNAYGVCSFGNNEPATRRMFEFAKKAGFDVFSASPAPDAFDMLDKLVEQYEVKIAIHNHGPGDKRWGKIAQLLDGTKDHHANIGVCLDTGHLIRSGEDPIEAVRKLGPRLLSFHFKDVNAQKHDVVVGTGTTDLVALFTALKETKFAGPFSLEYEIQANNPMPGIAQSIKALREAIARVS